MIFIASFINKKKHTPFDLDQRLPSQCNLSNIRRQGSSLGFESSFLESELARIQRCTLGAGGGGYGGTKERKIVFGRFPPCLPAIHAGRPGLLSSADVRSMLGAGYRDMRKSDTAPASCHREKPAWLPAVLRRSAKEGDQGREQSAPATGQRGWRHRAPGRPRPGPARSARASGGENPMTAFALSTSARAPSRLLSGGRAPSPNLFFLFGPQNPASSHGFYEIPSAHVGIKQAVLLVSWIRRAA